jgi:hypothetical protein
MAPGIVTPPVATVKVAASSVAGLIASLKVALSTWAIGTFAAAFAGTTAVTVGGGVIVVKVHTYLAGSGVPATLVAPVVMVAV